jgi:benzoate membrane transport protein
MDSLANYRGTADLPARRAILHNLKTAPRDLSVSSFTAGLLSVLVSITGPTVVVFKSAEVGHLSNLQTIQWLSIMWFVSGIFSWILTLRFRIPVLGAFATPGVALLVTSFAHATLPEIVGAYFVASALIFIIGVTGVFSTLIRYVPRPIVMAMLAGVLFPFGLDVFTSIPTYPFIVISMLGTFFLVRRLKLSAPILYTLIVGSLVSLLQGKVKFHNAKITYALPHWVAPHFSFIVIITVALPLALVVLTTQYAPGMAVLEANNYYQPTNFAIGVGGLLSLITAGFLNSGTNSAAISAAIAANEHAEPNQDRRYTAGLVNGTLYILVGIFASAVTVFFGGLPAGFIAALGGLGLLPTISGSIHDAFYDAQYRDAAAVTFLITISNIHPLNMGSPFWGLIAGVVIHWIIVFKKSS